MTADKWTRTAAWIARHLGDLDAPAAQPDHPNYPSPGVVAMALWGGGVNKRQANRALEYARGVVDRLAEENEGRAKGEAVTKLETRINLSEFEVRETGDGMTFTGYAAVFNSPSEPLPFIERIAPGAFRRSLKDRADIKLLWNHDTGEVLASTRSGTLKLYEDDKGLRVEAELANTQRGRDTAELVRTGRVDSMSFGFTVPPGGDQWSEDGSERTVKSVRLFEVSIVAFPAFSATAGGTAVRALDRVAIRAEVDVDALADALLKIENGEDITSDDRQLVEKVLDELYPVSDETDTVEAGDEDLSAELLALKKAKLKLLGGL
jgi:HK97 family phage prohead protease